LNRKGFNPAVLCFYMDDRKQNCLDLLEEMREKKSGEEKKMINEVHYMVQEHE